MAVYEDKTIEDNYLFTFNCRLGGGCCWAIDDKVIEDLGKLLHYFKFGQGDLQVYAWPNHAAIPIQYSICLLEQNYGIYMSLYHK
jgi:hypothetical protein